MITTCHKCRSPFEQSDIPYNHDPRCASFHYECIEQHFGWGDLTCPVCQTQVTIGSFYPDLSLQESIQALSERAVSGVAVGESRTVDPSVTPMSAPTSEFTKNVTFIKGKFSINKMPGTEYLSIMRSNPLVNEIISQIETETGKVPRKVQVDTEMRYVFLGMDKDVLQRLEGNDMRWYLIDCEEGNLLFNAATSQECKDFMESQGFALRKITE